jgi:hypothetical protein
MADWARTALGSLISLAFWLKRLAGIIWPFVENLNYSSHIRGPDGQAFPLPSRLRPSRTAKTAMGGAIRIDSIGFSGKAAHPLFGGTP